MLLHIDGSKHCWFQNSQRYDLIVILDDATSEIYYAQLVEEESTREHYIDAFNRKFAVGAEQKGSAFRRTSRSDLDLGVHGANGTDGRQRQHRRHW